MTNDLEQLGFRRQGFSKDFVIGLTLGGSTKAYYFTNVEGVGIINDQLGGYPVLIWAADGDYRAYLRQVEGEVLSFRLEGGRLVDVETGSSWDVRIGIAKDGPLTGQGLQPIPSLTSYDWAWEDFYPSSEFYQP
jgi:hypothetical protein